MKINLDSAVLSPIEILAVEEGIGGRYVCDTCLKSAHGWANQPVAIFYQETPHPQGSNYFGLFWGGMGDQLMITNGISATEDEFEGVLALDNVVYYSRYRNDFREIPGGFIDGGRDYLRRGGERIVNAKVVKLKIVGDELKVVMNEPEFYEVKALTYDQKRAELGI